MAREYSDQEAAHALAVLKSNRGNAKKTALQLGVPRTTLRQWAGRAASETARPKKVDAQVQMESASALANKWGQIAETATAIGLSALEGLDPNVLDAKAIKDVLTSGAIATDKQNLLTGQPTSRTEQQRVVYVVGNPLRDASLVAIGRTDPGTTPALEGEFVVDKDKSTSPVAEPFAHSTAD